MSSIYEGRPGDYESHASASAYNALYDRPAMLSLIGDVEGRLILDAGCGPGLYAEELLARKADVIAFDRSAGMIALARARLGDSATLRVHDLTEPLDWIADATVDAAVLALVLHHLDDRVAPLREIRRVLRPDGRLVLSTHHPMADWRRHGGSCFAVELIEETWQGDWDVRYWRQPLSASCAEFAEAGFLIERLVEPRPVPEMEELFPEDFRELSERPSFIMFSLVRPTL